MTKNAIEYEKAKEDARHNKATEKEAVERRNQDWKQHLNQEWNKRRMNQLSTLGSVTAAGLGTAGRLLATKNDRSFYDKFDPSLSNDLRLAITAYAGKGDVFSNSYEILPESDLPSRPSWWPNALDKKITQSKQAIVTFYFSPYIGDGGIGETPCNIAVRTFNSIVRAANSGPATNYDSVDLFMMPLACDSIVTIMCWAERGIELTKLVDPRDINTKEYGLLLSHCYNNASLVQLFLEHGAELIQILNSAKINYNALNLPYEFDYIKRHAFLASNYFKDGEYVGATYYLCNPMIYWVYDEANGQLTANNFYAWAQLTHLNWSSFRGILNSMISPLLNSQTVATMSGDMQKAFGSKLSQFDLIDINSINYNNKCISPVTDTLYLQSFKNAVICGPIENITDYSVKQNVVNGNPYLYQGVWPSTGWEGIRTEVMHFYMPDTDAIDGDVSEYDYYPNYFLRYFDFYDDKTISEEDILYNLSFYATRDRHLTDMRSEFINMCEIKNYNVFDDNHINGTFKQYLWGSNIEIVNMEPDVSVTLSKFLYKMTDVVEKYNLTDQCRFLPLLVPLYITQNSNAVYKLQGFTSWNRNRNRRTIDLDTIDRIQKVSIASMFYSKETQPNKANFNKKGKRD